jgi:hypothetical protein
MKTTKEAQELFGQFTGKTVEAVALWADANQKVVRELTDLSASTAKEGVRLYAELQSAAVEAVKDGQGHLLRWQGEVVEWQKDPFAWYQKALLEGVGATQRTFKLLEGNAQAITRSAEQLQATAERAAKEIQETFAALSARVKTLYSPSEN